MISQEVGLSLKLMNMQRTIDAMSGAGLPAEHLLSITRYLRSIAALSTDAAVSAELQAFANAYEELAHSKDPVLNRAVEERDEANHP